MKDCISEADNLIEIAEKFISENPDRIQKHIDTFNYCMERNLIN